MRTVLIALGLLAGCGALPSGDCGAAECAAVCAEGAVGALGGSGGAGGLSPFETALVGPLLDDVRQGIRPWSDTSVGICAGTGRECEGWVGATALDLPPGEYMMRAELRVPQVGDKGTWSVRFETECTTTKKTATGESNTTNVSSKAYDVQWVGEERGARLSPLYKITSPNKNGAQTCKWTLTPQQPGSQEAWTGSWSVPQG